MEKILVDEIGYNQYFDELNELKETLLSNAIVGSEVYKNDPGNGWHDNFAFEEVMRTEREISARIQKMIDNQKYLKKINNYKNDINKVNINDVVKLEFLYDDGTSEFDMIKLTGKYKPDENDDLREITLNSPLGKAIFNENIGKKISYNINDNISITVRIISKNNEVISNG